jgi:hypothetical protein
MTTYQIIKSYEGFPSKTRATETGLSLDEAKDFIVYKANQWSRNGGLVVSINENECILEEGDGSNVITLQIIEE